MVFQDPYASLNPRKRVVQIIGGPLRLHGADKDEIEDRVRELLRGWACTPSTPTASRTSSRAGSASGSAWRGRWPWSRS